MAKRQKFLQAKRCTNEIESNTAQLQFLTATQMHSPDKIDSGEGADGKGNQVGEGGDCDGNTSMLHHLAHSRKC